MVKVAQEGTIEVEVQEVERPDGRPVYRARVIGTDLWWTGLAPKAAAHGAVMAASDSAIADALGNLWEDTDPFDWADEVDPDDIEDLPNDLGLGGEKP